jgi:hypothetical protein
MEDLVRTRIWPGIVFLVVAVAAGPSPGEAAQDRTSPPDSTALVEEARQAQERFEAFRVNRIPPSTRVQQGGCDERIGRICQWFGGAEETDFPPESPQTGMARQELIGTLAWVWREVRDPWVLGQLVRYLMEGGRSGQAERLVRDCGLTEPWWCDALLGYVLHLRGDFVAAEAAFRSALDHLPEGEELRWRTPRFILPRGEEERFRTADDREQARLWERLWRFSDPLFMLEGNDRLTEHYTRLVAARMGEDSAHPFEFPWGEDLEEALIRFGRYIGWSRVRSPPRGMSLQDTRSVLGHHDPASRGYLFPGEFLEAPAEIPPEVWITSPREARTWYAPPYAPDFRGLEAQVARFRRGDSLLVAGAYRPDARSALANLPRAAPARPDPFAPLSGWDEEDDLAGPVEAALFLVPEDGGDFFRVSGEEREGVLTILAPAGRYVSSLEVLDRDGRAAWRARQGVTQTTLARGIAGISDVIVLRDDATLPESLDEAIPQMRPGIRVARGERFVLAWEVYGLAVEDVARVTIGFSSGRPGFMRRVGEFLGVVEPEVPVEVSFDESLPDDQVQVIFRAIEMQLPSLDPGEYTLHVQLELPGREPAVASRPIILEGR